MRRVAVLLAALMAAGAAVAHGWYPYECCSDNDCEPIPPHLVQRDDTAWLLPNGQRIPFEAARESKDEQFHWCRYTKEQAAPVIHPKDKAPCFFAPVGGT